MADNDGFLFNVAQAALLCGPANEVDTILYRQQALKDCLQNAGVIAEIYGLVVSAIEATKRKTWRITSHYPSSLLYSATDLLEMLVGMLRKLRDTAAAHASGFNSEAFTTLFGMLERELNEEYLLSIQDHLSISKFKKGILLSARLGDCNESAEFILRKPSDRKRNWFERLLRKGPPGYTFRVHERDEAGARILSEMRHRGISRVAVALTESADHVLCFFKMLRTELAFYIACTNLYAKLVGKGEPLCFPVPVETGRRQHRFRELCDVTLSLRMDGRVVGNTADINGKSLVVITGANQGGKSSFLRSVAAAQLMMQCGMFVGAESFVGDVCPTLFTHYRREEDVTMQSGQFDEELARMNEIVEHIVPNAMLFLNESFAATNEREGSEIARQIVSGLLEKGVRLFYVTHLFEFASAFFNKQRTDVVFLRAERKPDGTRTFKITEGEPLETSYGEDLYREIFGVDGDTAMNQSEDLDQYAGLQDVSSQRSERECHRS
ncbi:MAG: MutS-related protein [Candidatus Acidiferrales bacterium]